MNGGNMADTKKSSSLEQQMAEDEIFCMVEDWLGCKVSRNPKIKMNNNDKVHIEPDFYSEEHSIIGEIFAHIGENKRGQSTKIANDILKMLLIEKDRCKSYRKIIVVCDEQEERTLSGKSALAESIRQFGIELKRVEISNELRENRLSVEKSDEDIIELVNELKYSLDKRNYYISTKQTSYDKWVGGNLWKKSKPWRRLEKIFLWEKRKLQRH